MNEISLTPNGGMRKNWFISQKNLDAYKQDIVNTSSVENNYLDQLLKECQKRDLPISKYINVENISIIKKEKFSF